MPFVTVYLRGSLQLFKKVVLNTTLCCAACSIATKYMASVADVIVLAGNVGIERACGVVVPFIPGRGISMQCHVNAVHHNMY